MAQASKPSETTSNLSVNSTTVQPLKVNPLLDSSNWMELGALLLMVFGILAIWEKRSDKRRREDKEAADERSKRVLDAVKDTKEDIEKDLVLLKGQIVHNENGSKARDSALQHNQEKMETLRSSDLTRLVQLETRFENMQANVTEVKTMVRESREESNRKLDSLANQHDMAFKEICSSIREISKRDLKP